MIRQLKILYVEDHPDTADVVAKLLRYRGHEIDLADCYLQAMIAVSATSFDIILADIALPGKDGLELVREIRSRELRMRCVALSGHGRKEDIAKAMEAGFDDYLIKPTTFEKLCSTLEVVSPRQAAA